MKTGITGYSLEELKKIPRKDLPEQRYQKFRKMGVFAEK